MLKKIFKFLMFFLNSKYFNLISYNYLHKKNNTHVPQLIFDTPKRFNHKLIWLKMNYRHPEAYKFADKVLVKKIVKNIISENIVIPTIGLWRNAKDIDFSSLPESFILKTNHGSAWNILVHNKKSINRSLVQKQLNIWMNSNYFKIGREYQYKDIKPMILAEPLLDPGNGKELLDYKFFCFNGEPRFVQVDFDRFSNHTRNFYDMSWKRQPFTILYPPHPGDTVRPDNFDQMIDIARNLSEGFPFIRVDLYDCAGRIYFGELTFHPGGGFEPITPDIWDYTLGDMLILPTDNLS